MQIINQGINFTPVETELALRDRTLKTATLYLLINYNQWNGFDKLKAVKILLPGNYYQTSLI